MYAIYKPFFFSMTLPKTVQRYTQFDNEVNEVKESWRRKLKKLREIKEVREVKEFGLPSNSHLQSHYHIIPLPYYITPLSH
jgi:hypothetical protein